MFALKKKKKKESKKRERNKKNELIDLGWLNMDNLLRKRHFRAGKVNCINVPLTPTRINKPRATFQSSSIKPK